jgi:hypothetical protein
MNAGTNERMLNACFGIALHAVACGRLAFVHSSFRNRFDESSASFDPR